MRRFVFPMAILVGGTLALGLASISANAISSPLQCEADKSINKSDKKVSIFLKKNASHSVNAGKFVDLTSLKIRSIDKTTKTCSDLSSELIKFTPVGFTIDVASVPADGWYEISWKWHPGETPAAPIKGMTNAKAGYGVDMKPKVGARPSTTKNQ